MSSQQAFNQILSLVIMGTVGIGAFYVLHLLDVLRAPGRTKHVAVVSAAVLLATFLVVAPGVQLLRFEPPPYRDTRVGLEAGGLPPVGVPSADQPGRPALAGVARSERDR